MKKIITTIVSALICTIILAQTVPQGINYQAIARDATGDVLMNQTLIIQFSVITTSAISWQETHQATTNEYGLFTAIIGEGTPSGGTSATFDVIDWGSSNHSLKVEINYGNGYIDMGTTDFMSVPYSLHAKTAANGSTTDELQTLSISGDTLFISSGNYIILPSSVPTLLGCTDSTAFNYNPLANTDDGSCTYGTPACTDALACNYDASATVDDGSCTYAVAFYDCAGNCLVNTVDLYLTSNASYCDGWYGMSYTITDGNGIVQASGTPAGNWCADTVSLCLPDGCYDLAMDYTWVGYGWSMAGATGSSASGGSVTSNIVIGAGVCTILGCTDSLAVNYDPAANTDDGSCSFVAGCTDPCATNYNVSATYNDSSCFYLAIGDTYQGGVVFYLDGNGGGLIAAPSDQSSGAQWGCLGTVIAGADGKAIGTGNQNTIDIVAGCTTSGIAADICANYTDGTYSDWFLPSQHELDFMYLNIGRGNALGLGNIGGFIGAWGYWSSYEGGPNGALMQNLGHGEVIFHPRDLLHKVRCVRAF